MDPSMSLFLTPFPDTRKAATTHVSHYVFTFCVKKLFLSTVKNEIKCGTWKMRQVTY
jgi:hypothetical protein